MLRTRFPVEALLVALTVLGAGAIHGQEFPGRPIRINTGGAGGGNDFTARQIAQGISGPLGQPVLVDNRAPTIATETVAKAPPDGYALLVQGAAVWVNPLLQKMNYDAVRDLSPLSLISRDVSIVAVHPSIPAQSIKELIALAKARPGDLNYASTTPGGSTSLATALFKSLAGINIVNVPYKANGLALTGVISGEVQLIVLDAGLITPHMKSGKLRALAVTSATPSALTPNLPTVAGSGLPGYEAIGMTGIWAAAKTPAGIVNRLNQEIVRFLNVPEVKERFLNAGSEIVASSPEQFAAAIKSDVAKWSGVIKEAGIRVD